jgi:hypothetical protein
MKSKTLSLMRKYHKMLLEQDAQDPAAMDPAAAPEGAVEPPMPPPEPPPEPEQLKMTQQGENEYIKSIFELSKLYLDAVGNTDDKEQIDQISSAFDNDMQSGQVNGREYYKQYQKIMSTHMPDELRSLLGNF